MGASEVTIVFLIGCDGLAGFSAVYCCRLLSEFGHRCHIYFPPELAEENAELYDAVQRVAALPRISLCEPTSLPIKIDFLFCGLFGLFNHQARAFKFCETS